MSGSVETEEMRIKVVIDRKESEQDTVIKLAREAWTSYFGSERDHTSSEKCNNGVALRRKAIDVPDAICAGEQDWIRKRRRAVRASVDGCDVDLNTSSIACEWTKGHKKEALFQDERLTLRTVEALRDGILVDVEKKPWM